VALAVVLRVVAFLVAWTLITRVATDGVGLKLLTLAALAVVAAAWAALDGRRGVPLGPLLVSWAVVAGALGIYVAVYTWLPEPGVVFGGLAGDLIVVSPLIAGVTFAPAAIAGAAGTLAAANALARSR